MTAVLVYKLLERENQSIYDTYLNTFIRTCIRRQLENTSILFLTYLIMELLEKKTGERTNLWLKKAGKAGPVAGGVLGVIPQCGMSAVASNLYAGRIISVGTLIAIYLSTSDEMLPIMIAQSVDAVKIAKVLGIKVVIAMNAGILVDFIYNILKMKKYVK